MGKKEVSPLPVTGEKTILERRYQEDRSRASPTSLSGRWTFIWTTSAPTTLDCFSPTSIKSYLDGLLDQLEGRMSSLLYKQAVEQDLVAGILADAYQFSGEECADGGRRASKMCGRPMAASRWSSGCGRLGRMGMNGKTDRQSPYIKCGGNQGADGYMRYIAIQERVEIIPDDRPPTRKQGRRLITKLTKDFPDVKRAGV